MIENWRCALRSEIFIGYFFANVFGLIVALIFSAFGASINVYVVTLVAYSLSIAAPLLFDLINSKPPLDKRVRAITFILGLITVFLYLIIAITAKIVWISFISSIAITLITLFMWGSTYARDEKMDVTFPDRANFDNSQDAMKRLEEKAERDVVV